MTQAFRPSSITRYINCNLWSFLPSQKRSPEYETYLAARTEDHKRLEKEEFSEKESSCAAYFFSIKERCDYFFKEQRLSMEIGEKVFGGTADVYGYDEKYHKLYVLDYKTGRTYVKAEDNDQLLSYALLAMENHPDWEIEEVELAILNTQYDSVNIHEFRGNTPLLTLKSRIEWGIKANASEGSFGKPGKWCQFCPSKQYCIRQRNYKQLKEYADMDTDKLIFESKGRQNEIFSREKEVKAGVASQLLTPLIRERSRRSWKKVIPNKFCSMKPMTVSEAEEKFSLEEINPYIEKATFKVLAKPDLS